MITLYESRYLGGRRSKALFWYTFIHGNAYVVDMDLGGISVTNDAENVVADLVSAVKATGPYEVRRIFYRDSAGDWDELLHEKGIFKSFRPIPGLPDFEAVWDFITQIDCIVDGK